MKLFRFRGGVHPQENKHLAAEHAIRRLPIPERLHVPLLQHIGVPAAAHVKVGE